MTEEIEWIRADHLSARLSWPEDNFAQHVQLLNGLKSGRIAAKADNGNTHVVEEVVGHLGARTTESLWVDWLVPKSVWRDSPYHLYLRGRQYKYKLDAHGRFQKGDWLSVELTGLSFSLADTLRELGSDSAPSATEIPAANAAIQPKRRAGRKAKAGWPAFAAALAEWVIYRNDTAEEIVEMGPEAVMAEVLSILAQRSDDEFARSTYQPAVQELMEVLQESIRRK